jgi:predicted nucleic-acid-binding Zn-ribbon protein
MSEASQIGSEGGGEANDKASLRRTLDANHNQLTPEALRKALDVLFEEFKCLRCGHDEFFVGPIFGEQHLNETRPSVQSRTEIICKRCGLMETHHANILINSALGD